MQPEYRADLTMTVLIAWRSGEPGKIKIFNIDWFFTDSAEQIVAQSTSFTTSPCIF